MARRRYLSTDISKDKMVNRLATEIGDFAVVLYTWMIPHAGDDAVVVGDPEELLMVAMPGRRDKSPDDIAAALAAMHDLGLIVWDRDAATVHFPESFYKHQSYITEKRRCAVAPAKNGAESRKSPESAHISANQRTSPQNAASLSSSLSSSSSFSSSFSSDSETEGDSVPSGGVQRGADAPAAEAAPPPTPDTPPPPEKQQSPKRRAGATTPIGDWQPPAEAMAWAIRSPPDGLGLPEAFVRSETERFRDYWLGTGGRKADWPATWRGWMRKEAQDGRFAAGARASPNGHGPYRDATAASMAEIRRIARGET